MFANLNTSEIKQLIANGCSSANWNEIEVKVPFNPSHFKQVIFAGKVILGLSGGTIPFKRPDGQVTHYSSGISCSRLCNVVIGDNCFLRDIGDMENVVIGDKCVLIDIRHFTNRQEASFGNGGDDKNKIEALIETGGRALPLWVGYTANIVDLLLFHPKREKFKKEILKQIEKNHSVIQISQINKKHLGDSSCVAGAGRVEDMMIGEGAMIENISYLKNGTVDSSEKNPTIISDGVMAENFIIKAGAMVEKGAMIKNSFVGEGVKVSKQASITHSFLFANSEVSHSEVVACYLGPHTVSHHRPTLLIAGKFSFYNAGTGCGFANHQYRLGPRHQGIIDRGSKSSTNSYLTFPCHIGAFTTILGKHSKSIDSTDFPFSLLYEEKGTSKLYPGFNIGRVGLYRDVNKWKNREQRRETREDLYHHSAFNPYTLSQALSGYKLLCKEKSEAIFTGRGFQIDNRLILKALKLYEMLFSYLYYSACYQALENGWLSFKQLKNKSPTSIIDSDTDHWVDMGGMIIPLREVDALVQVADIKHLKAKLKAYFVGSEKYFCLWTIGELMGRKDIVKTIAITEFKTKKELIIRYQNQCLLYLQSVLEDSKKEFSKAMHIGYGLYGSRDKDFEYCQGAWQNDLFVKEIMGEIEKIKSI